ncbi:unnamed protein product [Paramecium sonneborni]|uniref:Uncharacterized protein n=1 Tax=Paramecium sonneborni TaxID=65129 RepID=A0A8S1PDV8_9CILI|nr:unnamed protein product [Paramecium sonneborni]
MVSQDCLISLVSFERAQNKQKRETLGEKQLLNEDDGQKSQFYLPIKILTNPLLSANEG